jgi:hypothetical protein
VNGQERQTSLGGHSRLYDVACRGDKGHHSEYGFVRNIGTEMVREVRSLGEASETASIVTG